MEMRRLGASGIEVSAIGVGAWPWGARYAWGFGRDYGLPEVEAAFRASLDAGVTFIDTAEIYAGGLSERIVGDLARADSRPVVIASKFAPFPWRLTARSVTRSLDRTLQRLGLERLDLYQVHFPLALIPLESLMGALAEAVKGGKVRAVGVSNYGAVQMRRAHAALARRGVPLASNQVKYSLLHRGPEASGVLAACRELDIALIAHTPLAQGILTGKYRPGTSPRDIRRFRGDFRRRSLRAAAPVVETLERIGREHGKTPGQGALNWLLRQEGVIPIPGAKNDRQARENAGAAGWRMSDDEAAELDRVSVRWRR